MRSRPPLRISDDDVFTLTDKGDQELRSAGTDLPVADLEVLVLVDGFSPVAQIAHVAPGLKRAELDAVLGKLLAQKLIAPADLPSSDGTAGFGTIAIPAGFFSSLRDDGGAGATILRKKGYYVRIARRSVRAPRPAGWQPTVLFIDDDPIVQKLVRTYFSMEGIRHRAALKRDDIVIALRQKPSPDLILLDVNLPDADGFDLLSRFREHPVLRALPIVMLTSEATREAVLKGLKGGADGYVTKPFEPDILVAAIRTVLGVEGTGPAEMTLPGGRKA